MLSPQTNVLFGESYRSKKFRTFGLSQAQAFNIREVEVAKQPNINMALQDEFIGKSQSGNLKEAIQNALKKARVHHDVKEAWVIEKIAENQLKLGPISVQIRVGPKGKGEGGGIGPR